MSRLLLTLTRSAARTTVRNTAWAATALASWAAVGALTPAPAVQEHTVVVDRAAVLVERHACWTAAAPEGSEPRHAVVTLADGRPRLVRAATGFRIWLEGEPGVVHAFCP